MAEWQRARSSYHSMAECQGARILEWQRARILERQNGRELGS